jgi:hypothetical protein
MAWQTLTKRYLRYKRLLKNPNARPDDDVNMPLLTYDKLMLLLR